MQGVFIPLLYSSRATTHNGSFQVFQLYDDEDQLESAVVVTLAFLTQVEASPSPSSNVQCMNYTRDLDVIMIELLSGPG